MRLEDRLYMKDRPYAPHEEPKMKALLRVLDLLFHFLHSGLILFVLFGWIAGRTRFAHLVTTLAILFSWCVLGIFFGFGYCIITDYHWRIKRKLNQGRLPEGYVKYMLDKITGRDTDPDFAENLARATLIVVFIITIIVNFLL